MFWVVIIVIVVLVILWKVGLFRKPAVCEYCGKELKGTQQKLWGTGESRFILCSECEGRIPVQAISYAVSNWNLDDYKNCLAWDEATRAEREAFAPTDVYGKGAISIDTDHALFRIEDYGLVLRFADLRDYEFGFKPGEVKDGILGARVTGDEFFTVDMFAPRIYLERILKYGVSYKLKQKGFINTKYEYEFSKEFSEIINTFEIMVYLARNARNAQSQAQTMQVSEIDEVQKALALFMFDSLDDVTEDNLKKQRNALIKAFHPDNAESNEAYSQKINSAYELLRGFIKQ